MIITLIEIFLLAMFCYLLIKTKSAEMKLVNTFITICISILCFYNADIHNSDHSFLNGLLYMSLAPFIWLVGLLQCAENDLIKELEELKRQRINQIFNPN